MKKLIVACGSGIATSTAIHSKLDSLLQENGIQCNVIQCAFNEVDSYIDGCDAILIPGTKSTEYPCPVIPCFAWLSGVGEEELNEKILSILKQ